MPQADLLVTAFAVVRNEAAILPAFVSEVVAILACHYSNYEIILVDNGSVDATSETVRNLLQAQKCLRYLRLTRPVEDETAMLAGLDAAIGDYVVVINPDFDPPAEIPAMVDACRGGADLVNGVDRHPAPPRPLYRFARNLFLKLSRRIAHVEVTQGTTGYRVMSRQAVNALVKVRLRRRYFAVVAADVGLTMKPHPYDRISRSGTQPTTNLFRALRIGLSVLVHNSITPLRMASVLGLVGSAACFCYSLYAVLIYLFKPDVMPGWTTLSFAMSMLFSLVFLILALMGEYLGRLLEESTNRPLYHVREEQSSAVMLVDLQRRNVEQRSVVQQ